MKEAQKTMPADLKFAQKKAYEPLAMVIENLRLEDESSDYGAAEFEINQQRVKFRVAKITPTKIGQFVTFWKRVGKGPIIPYDLEDPFDLYIVNVRDFGHFGQFIFPKGVLHAKGLLSKKNTGGKRAMRVYPPWDKADNAQAQKTQKWQLNYFIEIDENREIDFERMKFLLQCEKAKSFLQVM